MKKIHYLGNEKFLPGMAQIQDQLGFRLDEGGYEITCVTELTRMLRRFEPGETVSITVYRGGQELTLSITLDEKPRADGQEPEILMPGDDGFEEWYEDFIEEYLD